MSSGERQLLVLFSNIVSLRGSPSILLIDEPELSLNPIWQRKLFPALTKFVQGSEIQIICATHSMEILAQNPEYVKELDDIENHR
jgi:predicted ATP-dependent endonuclease of OLD family